MSACFAPSWYTQGLACGEGNGLNVERIRNTDFVFLILGEVFFLTAWQPYNSLMFLFHLFFWDRNWSEGHLFHSKWLFHGHINLMLILWILRYYIPLFSPQIPSILSCIENKTGEEVGKEPCLRWCIPVLFLAETTVKLLECCSVHIKVYDARVEIMYKMWTFPLQTVCVNMFWPTCFGSWFCYGLKTSFIVLL